MKKYNLKVLAGYTHWDVSVFAEKIITQTTNSSSSGCYSFLIDKNVLVASYPIDRTIITSIENLEEDGE